MNLFLLSWKNLELQLVHQKLFEDQVTVPQEILEEDEDLPNNTNEISKVSFTYQLWFHSGDRYTLFIVKGHQKQSEVHLQNELRTKKLYYWTY